MTEDDARKKWCPFARVGDWNEGDKAGVSLNRYRDPDTEIPDFALCIASACMAWHTEVIDVRGKHHGYCGLAGKPPKPL